jgi:hypothetical protein
MGAMTVAARIGIDIRKRTVSLPDGLPTELHEQATVKGRRLLDLILARRTDRRGAPLTPAPRPTSLANHSDSTTSVGRTAAEIQPCHRPPRAVACRRSRRTFVSNDSDGHRAHAASRPPADLSHLHPDNVRIGSIGVFAGDWAFTGEPPRIPVGFVGTLVDRWDKSAVWRCTREVAEAVVAEQHRLRQAERARLVELGQSGAALDRSVDEYRPPVWFDGDDLVLDETAQYGEPAVDRQSPGEDGRYCPMGFHWTWIAVDPADCDRIVGALPALGEHREFVLATHQPLRMPHDRLTVTAVNPMPTSDGIAYTATLRLDGQPVGTVEHTGDGSTVFHPAGHGLGRADLDVFVDGCRWRGRAASEGTVLQALVAEYEITAQTAAAEADGLALIVLRDGDEHVVSTDYRLGRSHVGAGGMQMLAMRLTAAAAERYPDQAQFVWQVWTGDRWRLIGIVDVPRGDNPAGAR